MSEWQPIESAPKDGTPILVCGGEFFSGYGAEPLGEEVAGGVAKVSWARAPYSTEMAWVLSDACYYGQFIRDPSYWQPLPAPKNPALIREPG